MILMKWDGQVTNLEGIYDGFENEFVGYDLNEVETEITHILSSGKEVSELNEGEKGAVILDKTPFLCTIWRTDWRYRNYQF